MLRIAGGQFRGRIIQTPEGDKTRPTSGMVREAVFSMLQREIPGANVLDVFCGSGAMTIEAMSRGARHGVMIDFAAPAVTVARNNVKMLSLEDKTEIYQNDYARALQLLAKAERTFDVVFMDPPYALGYYERALMLCVPLMSESSLAVLEHDSANPLPERFSGCVLYKRKKYGKRAISVYRKESEQ